MSFTGQTLRGLAQIRFLGRTHVVKSSGRQVVRSHKWEAQDD